MDRLGRLYLVVASLYWAFKYLPGVVEDYGAKGGDVSGGQSVNLVGLDGPVGVFFLGGGVIVVLIRSG